jgi:Ca-activated chloride channel homolog
MNKNLLRLTILVFFLSLSYLSPAQQYYLKGEIKSELGEPLQNVRIVVQSSGLLYSSGESGGFGISTKILYDTLKISLLGYEEKIIGVRADQYQNITLKPASVNTNTHKKKLSSFTKDRDLQNQRNSIYGDESYSVLVENNFIKAANFPNTGFAVRIDKASYSNIRRFLNEKSKMPEDAVRVEEMLNYFNFNYKEPQGKDIFKIESQLTACPWEKSHQLLFLNINAKKLVKEDIPASNFVFLIDNSGSMDQPNRLPLLKEAFQLLVRNLRDKDYVSIVTYGGGVSIALQPTSGKDKQKIIKAIEELTAAGDTPGEEGLVTAYRVAKASFITGGNNRIILATDGDFNVGMTNDKDLEDLVLRERVSKVSLTCLGVGMGNYKDSKIEGLAKKGNGNFAYLDNIREAEKYLITELAQNLYTVAKDVYLNVQFSSSLVKEYRLIGYENKMNALADSTSDLEGGEVGSGNSTTAIFEIVPARPGIFKEPSVTGSIASLQLNYKPFNDSSQQMLRYVCPNNYVEFDKLNKDLKFASAVAMFGLLLKQSKYITVDAWNLILPIARASMNPQDYLQNEFLALVQKAQNIYLKKKVRKKMKIKPYLL